MKESEIRPKEIFHQYLELSKKDAEAFDKGTFERTNCVACNSVNCDVLFEKSGFNLELCHDCNSLFCNPRPSQDQLSEFYQHSASAKFWFGEFLPQVEEARREKLFSKKAKDLFQILQDRNISIESLCDIGAGSGIFLEELQRIKPQVNYCAIEPGDVSSGILRTKGFEVLQKSVEQADEWQEKFDFAVSLEVFEHVHNPENFLRSIAGLLKENGTCLITTLGYEGFDILTLGKDSNSISPPHHLNFLSVDGFRLLFEKVGFRHIEILTPGVLDVDIVLNHEPKSTFLEVLRARGAEALADFQNLLIKHQLSSHVWIIASK